MEEDRHESAPDVPVNIPVDPEPTETETSIAPMHAIQDDADEVIRWCRVLTGAVTDFKKKLAAKGKLESTDHEALHEVCRALAAIPRAL